MYFAAAIVGAVIPSGKAGSGAPGTQIALLAGPIHYDILLPLTPRMRAEFGFLQDADLPLDHPQAAWLIVGWGAREFYTQTGDYGDLSARAIWRGVTGDASVLRFDLATDQVENLGLEYITLQPDQLDRLVASIQGQITDDDPLDIPGLTRTDVFYAAQGRFHLFRTCNVWIGQQLRNAGLRFGIWTPTTYAVR